MAKKSKAKTMTFRQRLRADAELKLDKMMSSMGTAGIRVCEEHNSEIDHTLLMQLASQPVQGKTLRSKLIGELANEAEAAVEKIYNNQQGLDLGDDNG